MIKSKINSSLVLRLTGLLIWGPLVLAGCAGGSSGGGLSDSASLGLAGGGVHHVHVPGTFAPTAARAQGELLSHSRAALPHSVPLAKKHKTKSVRVARGSRSLKRLRGAVRRQAKHAVMKHRIVRKQPAIYKAAKVLLKMKPIKAVPVRLARAKPLSPQAETKMQGRLEPAISGEKLVATGKAEPMLRDKAAPVSFEFGKSTHHFSSGP